jgi:hypothetical protein
VTGGQAAEPALAEVAAQFPGWQCWQGPNRLCYARDPATGTQVRGEDPLDLRDQLGAAERLRAYEREAAGGDPQAGPWGRP